MSKLDPNEVRINLEKYGFDSYPPIEYENDDFNIQIQPIPMIESKREKISENPIGIHPFKTFLGGGEDSLRKSILKKAKRYGDFDIPYLICINALGERTSDKTAIENVMWGSLQYTYSTNPENRNGRMIRKDDGIFYNAGKRRLTNVSGIFVTKIFPSNIPNARYWLYENPFADNKLDFNDFGLVYNSIKANQIVSKEGIDFDRIFGISKNWIH